MKQVCLHCQEPKFIIAQGLCAGCLLLRKTTGSVKLVRPAKPSIITEVVQSSAAPPKSNGVKPANGDSAAKKGTVYICDGCDKEFKTLQKFGKLNLCVECFTKEHNAANELQAYDPANYKTWPRCNSCHAHVVREQLAENSGLCFKCATAKQSKVETLIVKATDSSKYQEFFNAETQAITDLFKEQGDEQGILSLRQLIIDGAEDLLKVKTVQQARTVKYNELLSGLSEEKRNSLRIEDANYKPKSGEPRKLKSPMAQTEKIKKIKKSLDDQINAMFGGTLSPDEIAEKKRALGM